MEYFQPAGSAAAGGGSSSVPLQSAGIIAYILPKEKQPGKFLVGHNSSYSIYSYGSQTGSDELRWLDEDKKHPNIDKKTGLQRVIKAKTVDQFIDGFDFLTPAQKTNMLTTLKTNYGLQHDKNLINQATTIGLDLFVCMKEIFPETLLNSAIRDQFHLLNLGYGIGIASKGKIRYTFPKGGKEDKDAGSLFATAKREFREETGFDLDSIRGLNFKEINFRGNYQFYFVIINDDIGRDILQAYNGGGGSVGHRYYSELFNLQFIDNPDLLLDEPNLLEKSILNECLKLPEVLAAIPKNPTKEGFKSSGLSWKKYLISLGIDPDNTPHKQPYIVGYKPPIDIEEGDGGAARAARAPTKEEYEAYPEYKRTNPTKTWNDYLGSIGIRAIDYFKYQEPKQGGGDIDYQQKFQKYQQKLLNN
jgi:8-oxo-dGTP pyrophosphatase MutT (NUDIX family)